MSKGSRGALSLLVIVAVSALPVIGSASAAPSTQWQQCGTVPYQGSDSRLNAEALRSPCAPALQIARAFAGDFRSHCGLDENYRLVCHLSGFTCPLYGRAPGSSILCTKEQARVRIKSAHKH